MNHNSIRQLQKISLFTVFLVVVVLFFWMFKPYLFSIFWAGVLASLFYPLYKAIFAKTKKQNTSALATLFTVILLVILPLLVVSGMIVNEAITLYNNLTNQTTINDIKSFVDQASRFPTFQNFAESIAIEKELKNVSSEVMTTILNWLKLWTQDMALLIINLFVMLYALFFFLKDGEKLLTYLKRLSPLEDNIDTILYNKFISTSRATLKGTIVIGFVQGALGGLTILIADIPSVFFLTLVMIILSIIPALGSFIILLPILIYLLFSGSVWQVVVLILGMFIVSVSDNFLRPILVGKDTNMHPLLIFLSTVGGLGMFGISGIVIGPIITSLLVSTLEIYQKRYS